MLTNEQQTILNCYGSQAIRSHVKNGELPDSPEVNARIAERCFWETPGNWTWGAWFWSDYVKAQYRSGRVAVQRVVFPNGEVRFRVAGQSGRWCDSLTTEQAQEHLVAHRKHGIVVYLSVSEAIRAEDDYRFALSR